MQVIFLGRATLHILDIVQILRCSLASDGVLHTIGHDCFGEAHLRMSRPKLKSMLCNTVVLPSAKMAAQRSVFDTMGDGQAETFGIHLWRHKGARISRTALVSLLLQWSLSAGHTALSAHPAPALLVSALNILSPH